MRKLNKKKARLLRVLSLSLIAVIFSVYAISGVNAKYRTEKSGDVTAQVAKFEIVNTGTDQKITVPDLDFNLYDESTFNRTVNFNVISKSDVSVKYDVIVTLPATDYGNRWLIPSLVVEDSSSNVIYFDVSATKTEFVEEENVYVHTFTYEDLKFGPVSDTAPSHSVTLRLGVVPAYYGNESLFGDFTPSPFEIKVHVEQID